MTVSDFRIVTPSGNAYLSANLPGAPIDGEEALSWVEVLRSAPPVNWPAPGPIIYGTALSETQLNATCTIPGTFDYDPPQGSILDAGSDRVLSVTFTPTDVGLYGSQVVSRSLIVGKAAQTISFPTPGTQGLGTFPLSASTSSGRPVLFTIDHGEGVLTGGVLTVSRSGLITITAHLEGTENYLPATPVTRTFAVVEQSQSGSDSGAGGGGGGCGAGAVGFLVLAWMAVLGVRRPRDA